MIIHGRSPSLPQALLSGLEPWILIPSIWIFRVLDLKVGQNLLLMEVYFDQPTNPFQPLHQSSVHLMFEELFGFYPVPQ